MDHHLGDNEEGNDRSSGEGGSNNTQQKIFSLRDSSDEFAMFSFKIGACVLFSFFLFFVFAPSLRHPSISKLIILPNSRLFFNNNNNNKTVPCARTRAHDWTLCPYAHPGEKAKRRDLKMFSYTAIPCADYQKVPANNTKAKGSHEYFCPRGASCPYAHGVFESWLHPSRYRTQLCKDGLRCTRKACFFAHRAKELRNVRTAANAEVNPDGNIENTNNNDGDNINNNNYSNSNDNNSNKSTVDTVAKTMISTTMQHQHQQQQQQQLAQSRSESWAAVHANLQNPAASSQLGSIEYGKSGPLTRLSFESVNDERRRYQQNYDQFVSQQQISQMTVNQELSALHLSQRQRELEQQQLLLLQQQDQEQQKQQQQMNFATNAAIVQQIQQLQQQQLQLQQMQQMRQMQQMQQKQTQQEQTSPRDGKKKSSYDDLGMIEDAP
jgi:hypothetical protein